MAMNVVDAIARALERCSRALCDAAGWMLAAMAVLINVEVVARYVFNTSTLIADEFSGYLFVWSTLLGFGWALQSGQFLRVEAVVGRLPHRARRACDLVAAITGLAVSVVCIEATWALLAGSWRFASRSIQPSATPLWVPQLLLPLGFAWLAILYLHAIVRLSIAYREPDQAAEPEAAPTTERSR